MTNSDPTLSYRQASARGTSPVGQVVSLYDTILRDFGRALAALRTGDVEARVFELNHALLVIGHLHCVLNFEAGGEPAKQFEHLYSVTRGMIVNANVRATPDALEELIELYGGLRQAWFQADQQLTAAQQPERVSDRPRKNKAVTPAAGDTDDDVEMSQLQWSA